MADKLTYNGKTYTVNPSGARIDKLMSTAAHMGDSLPAAELSVDTLNATLRDYDTEPRLLVAGGLPVVVEGQLAAAQRSSRRLDQEQIYGSKVQYYHNDSLLGAFRLESIKRVGRYEFALSCISAIGLLLTSRHYGGIYSGETAAEVMADIVDGIIPYTLADELASVPIYGYLPVASRRDNLRDLLFALGGQIRKDASGELHIVAMTAGEPYEITADDFYMGGSVTGGNPASEIRVTEHSYVRLASDETVTLFDGESAAEELVTPKGRTVTGVLVDFTEPMHDLAAQNVEILESGVNYAVISGSPAAILTGQRYTHTERTIPRKQNTGGAPNVVRAKTCTLVNLLNAELVADRLMAYYGSGKTVEAEIVVTKQKPGDAVTFVDPFGDATTGFISDMELTMSAILRAKTTLVSGYIPTASGNYYSKVAVVSESGTFTVPAECRGKIRVVLIGGGDGGEAGQNGATATGGGSLIDSYNAKGGEGGAPGKGGVPGKVFVGTLNVKPGQTFAVTIGPGGTGAPPDGSPEKGGATTFGDFTSENGHLPEAGYNALVSREIYALHGADGIAGGRGNGPNNEGTTVTDHDGTVYSFGERGKNGSYGNAGGLGGYGGGPAIRSNGSSGGDGYGYYNNGYYWGQGGDGGAGADAAPGDNAVIPGSGGSGGHGGGGGGACGGGYNNEGSSSDRSHGDNGVGGKGGSGGNGASGVVLIYY